MAVVVATAEMTMMATANGGGNDSSKHDDDGDGNGGGNCAGEETGRDSFVRLFEELAGMDTSKRISCGSDTGFRATTLSFPFAPSLLWHNK